MMKNIRPKWNIFFGYQIKRIIIYYSQFYEKEIKLNYIFGEFQTYIRYIFIWASGSMFGKENYFNKTADKYEKIQGIPEEKTNMVMDMVNGIQQSKPKDNSEPESILMKLKKKNFVFC